MEVELHRRRVYVGDWGRCSDPPRAPVLLIHGAGMDHRVWALLGRALACHGFHALAPDLPGHGRSQPLADCCSIEQQAAWLSDLLGVLPIDRVSLIGHSMGGLVAMALAARDPRVERLVLIGTAARMPVHPALLAAARTDLPRAVAMIVNWAFAFARKIGAQPVPGVWMPMLAMRLLQASPPGILAQDLAACDAWANGEAAARAIRCPTLVLTGAEDRMTPPRAVRQLAELIPQAEFLSLAGCGHMPIMECPRELWLHLQRFLARR